MTATDVGEHVNAAGATELPWIVSVDDHVVEPAHLFERWMPREFHDRAPKVERRKFSRQATVNVGQNMAALVEEDDGMPGDCWTFGSALYVHRKHVTVLKDVETCPESRSHEPVTYDEMRPGCYDPKARMQDMTDNHVEASLGFPSFPRFCGQMFYEQTTNDRELGLACVRAYNDWMVEEWCGDSGGRLIPLCLVPLWDVDEAVKEIRRNAARGVRAVAFSEIVYHLGLPSIHSRYWDPFFAACEETGTVICMHIGSSSNPYVTSPDAPAVVLTVTIFSGAMASITDFIFSGVLDRFPRLKLAYSESQIGWMPYVLERLDSAWDNHTWSHGEALSKRPSTYFRQSIYGCFFDDRHGVECIDIIGEDNVTFETDYPHSDGSFPHTYQHALKQFEGIDRRIVEKVVRGNAIKLFGLDLPGLGNGTGQL